ncbi:MAG: exosortase, partial [Gammaproteobacteria bacterium]|nr:exosortase [Gammaproteobacteria bacterium]
MTSAATRPAGTPSWLFAALFGAAWILLLFAFRDGLIEMERRWGTPEYSHAYLIPFLALYVLSARLTVLRATRLTGSWAGIAVIVVGLLAFLIGELSALYIIVQYAFLLVLWGLMLTVLGVAGSRVIWAALVFLVFLIPLPYFLEYALSGQLQLISSELGTSILRVMGVTVFLEGNIIDLGSYKLQVVEACSGLRYLFPLMSFGFLCAVMFKGPVWQRWVIFLSSLPITVFMNSFRIAVTGLLVNQFGNQAAEGFLHYFEGWVIFTACLALMFLEMVVLARLGGRRLDDALDLYIPTMADFQGWFSGRSVGRPLMVAVLLLAAGAVFSVALKGRDEIVPP